MSNAISKAYSSIKELPSEVRSSFDERDQEKWMNAYNEASQNKEPEEAKVDAWMSMVDAPSSLAVETWGSVEVRDADGELVPIDTITEYADKFIENGGLMHDSHSNVPVGTVWNWEVRKHPETGQDGVVFYFNVYRDGEVFERARDDILSGRKQAVSIGAEAPRGGYKCDDRGCYVERDVTDLYELSICETPANPEAYFINVGKDIAKSKRPLKGEKFRIGIKDITVHQDYTTCPLQKAKHDLLDKGFKNVHIKDDTVTAKSRRNEYNLLKAIQELGYPYRYDIKKQEFEIIPDYGVEQAIEEALGNGWAHEDNIGHVTLTKEIPKEVFMDWYDRGFIVKIGDNYCLKGDDVAKDSLRKEWTDAHHRLADALDSIVTRAIYYEEGNYIEDDRRELYRLYDRLIEDEYVDVEKYRNAINTFDRNCTTDAFKDDIRICMTALDEIYEQNLKDAEELVNRMLDGIEEGYRKRQMHEWFEQTFGKLKKDAGAMGVSTAGASNPVYGSKPRSLVTPTGDKKYGKKVKTKKEFTDDRNIHAVGSRQAKRKVQ